MEIIYNIGVSVISAMIIFIVGIIWNKSLKKSEPIDLNFSKNICLACSFLLTMGVFCSVSFPNTDDSISEALDYVEPCNQLSDIMESLK